jgi:glycosyltransferase involved in cell wall biosynthesis
LLFPQDDAQALAARIRGLLDAGPEVRERIGRELRARVERDHSVGHWADGVLEAAR